ncbi:unnamed protein product [Vicia faba]|uniref:Uncharacterized protein n=1 Tax=Vicia faba TaxID=3906 RepID=A0AAV0ZFP0_VICFA|nr:unnamed protein product [Vicia faba]
MVVLHECDEYGVILKLQNAEERYAMWRACMRGCKKGLGREEFDRIMLEVYGDIYGSFSNSDPQSSSSGSMEILIETSGSFSKKVMGYEQISMDEVEIEKLRSLRKVS